jgi:hypothetical protein
VLPPKWVYPYVIADSRNIIKGAPFDSGPDSALFADLKAKVNKLAIAQPEKTRLIEAGRKALVEEVKPAYGRVIALMQAQQKVARNDDGIWRFPNGAEQYSALLRYYTTTGMNADQIHTLGLQQVARIHGEMSAIQRQVGFPGTLQQFFAHMRTRPQNFFPNTPAGRQMYLDETDRVMKAMTARLPEYFSEAATPKAPLNVKAVEPFREKSAGKAFYQDPSPDGVRPGVYYVNLYDMRDMPHIELEALAFHEGVPGHHLDGAVTTRLENIPPFRRFGGYTAWSEGWGLYAEKLGKDMGFYTDPYRDFGRLQLELHRAIRLVVDSGLHHKRWTRQQAIDYVQNNSADAPGRHRQGDRALHRLSRPGDRLHGRPPQDQRTARPRAGAARQPLRHARLPRCGAAQRRGAAGRDGAQCRRLDREPAARPILPGTGRGQRSCRGGSRRTCALGAPPRASRAPPVPGRIYPPHQIPQRRASCSALCGTRLLRAVLKPGVRWNSSRSRCRSMISAGPVTIRLHSCARSSGQSATTSGSGSAPR